MAQKLQVVFVDDLTGEVLPDGQGQTVSFGLDGTSYELDLNKDNAAALRQTFKRYVRAGRRAGRSAGGTTRSSSAGHKDTAAIRT
ncbi:Lsr2 family protein [Geodermatophilus sp. DSM 45219]|uniref:histone-like nucleoid-structuring protein Lsr2 n=1 Tax=Geodermatophilus sp. DSM 45219 TaxID=1881103 RepID=UPI00088D9829|nr:Lsr2 family protein [Geodermatophilus sp. DSM 45219]SDN38571.1 Lsr2 protein [Geodermatophilus sp. DSM 45219]